MIRIFIVSFMLFCSVLAVGQNNIGPGNALELNGSGDWVDLGPSLRNMTLPVTVCMWVNPDMMTEGTVFTSNKTPTLTSHYGIWVNIGSTRIRAHFGNGTGGFSAASRNTYRVDFPNDFMGEWIHVAVVFRQVNDMDIYVNGILQSGTYSGSSANFDNSLNGFAWIGKGQAGSTSYYNGEVDEFSLWDRELSQQEIRDLMCRKIDPNAPDLLIAYDFNEANTSNSFNNLGTIGQNGVRNGANTVASEAPVGDSSVHAYTIVSQAVSLSMSGNLFQLTDLQTPTEGVHLYKILNDITIPSGSGCVEEDSYGIFIADDDFSNNDDYDLAMGNSGALALTRSSILTVWQASGTAINGHIYHNQYVLEASPVGSFLPDDTTLCLGQPITITITEPGTYVWENGSTSTTRVISSVGTYWATLTSAGCSVTDTVVVTHYNGAFLPFSDTTLCANDSVFYDFSGGTLTWADGQVGGRYLFPGNSYTVEVVGPSCSVLYAINVGLDELPSDPGLDPEYRFCEGSSVNISLTDPVGDIVWDNGSSSPNRSINSEGTYWVEISSSCGSITDTFEVVSESCDGPDLFIPNAFTPNADGLNDVFTIGNLGGIEFTWSIYSRWGQRVFQTSDSNQGWDGTYNDAQLPESTYFYIIQYKDNSGAIIERSGTIALMM